MPLWAVSTAGRRRGVMPAASVLPETPGQRGAHQREGFSAASDGADLGEAAAPGELSSEATSAPGADRERSAHASRAAHRWLRLASHQKAAVLPLDSSQTMTLGRTHSNKVYVTDEEAAGAGPSVVLLADASPRSPDPGAPTVPRKRANPSPKTRKRRWVRLLRLPYVGLRRWLLHPLKKQYERRVSWSTRQTFAVATRFFAAVYVFFSVPFRIGFLYSPFPAHRHDWTEDLTAFTVLDVLVDIIGVYEFCELFRLYRDSFSQLAASVDFELGKKMWRETVKMRASSKMMGGSNPAALKPQWTLATIGANAGNNATSGYAVRSRSRRAQDHEVQWAELIKRIKKMLVVGLEAVAIIPFEVIPLASGNYNALHLARIAKIVRVYRLAHCVERFLRIYSEHWWARRLSHTGISTLVRNIGVGIGLIHWISCGYMLLAHLRCGVALELCDPSEETSWVIRDHLVGAWTTRKYARALYWASRTIVLLGYSDVTPVSSAETLYVTVVQFIGAVFSSSILALFLFIFRHRNARHSTFLAHVDNAREYMKSQNLPRELRQKVAAFFNYTWQTHHSLDSEEALHHLPKHLQSKIVATLKASRVKQVCFLMKESTEFINLLALSLRRRVYSPNDHIIEPKINAKMFFVINGTVSLCGFDGSNSKECQTGDFFADSCLLAPEAYEEKAIAKTFCELYVLEKSEFDEALAHFYRDDQGEVRARMAEVLDKYATQLRKTKQLLGLRGGGGGGGESARSSAFMHSSHDIARGVDATASTTKSRAAALAWYLPGSVVRMRWNLLELLGTLYVAFEVPYFAAFISSRHAAHIFDIHQQLGVRYVVTLLVELIFAVDIVLRARFFAYVDPIVMLPVTDPEMIFTAYKCDGGFWLDLIACLPIGLTLESVDSLVRSYSWWFRLARLLRLRRVPFFLKDLVEYHGMSSKFHFVLLLALGVGLMLHAVGCVWFEMAWIFQPNGELHHDADSALSRAHCLEMATLFQNCSWVIFDCYGQVRSEFPVYNKTETHYRGPFAYLRSVYWAVVALTGVGYGDILAFSTAETYFAAFWIFVGALVNFCVIGAMSSTLTSLTASQHHHVEKINALNTIMEHLTISEDLRRELRQFYHHQFHRRKKAYESQLLSHLPEQLCYEISTLLHADATKRVSLFDSASPGFLEEVTGKFRHRTYQNGETICIEGDVCREFIVLLYGRVNMYTQGRKVPVRALHDGDCYGVSEFLAKRAHSVTLIAASAIEASVMTRDQFDVVQRKFEDDYKDIRDEAMQIWAEEQSRLRRVFTNLERLKLQTHVLHTPSLFYNRDQLAAANGDGKASAHTAHESPEAVRTRVASAWNSLFTALNMYNAFFIIFRICFHSHLHFSTTTYAGIAIADVVCDVCFALDIYLRLYYFDVVDPSAAWDNLWQRKEMAQHYRYSRRFKRDVVASLPVFLFSNRLPLVSSLCRLPRLLRITDLWVLLDEWIVLIQQRFASRNVSSYLSPLKLAIIFVLIAHYAGCIFFLISEWECHDDEYCWIESDHLIHTYHESLSSLYIRSYYWALTTLTLVGSNEIVPRRMVGTLWATLTCLACTFIMGHVLDELSTLIMDVDKEAKEHKRRIDGFERFAKEHQLPEALRTRVTAFLDIQFKQTEGRDLHETTHDLSANLKLKLMHEIYGASLLAMPISRHLTHSQINNLALRLQEELFVPGDSIVAEDTLGSRLCILKRGTAAVFWTQSATPIAVLLEGCLFGEVAFFLQDQRRIASVKATTSCDVLYVSKNDWQELWMFNGDASDNQVQKYAQHSIIEWLMERLQGYQQCSLRIADKAKRLLATRSKATANASKNLSQHHHLHLFGAATSRPAGPSEHSKTGGGRDGKGPWHPTRSFPEKRRSSFTMAASPATHLLEKKARYLLAKSDALAKKYEAMLVGNIQRRRRLSSRSSRDGQRRSESDITGRRPSLNLSVRYTTSRAAANAANAAHLSTSSSATYRLFIQQFIVMINPINHHLRDSMDDQAILSLENECWSRFKYIGAVHQVADNVMKALRSDISSTVPKTHSKGDTSPSANPAGRRPSMIRRARSVAARRKAGGRITQLVKVNSFAGNDLGPEGAINALKKQAKLLAMEANGNMGSDGGHKTTARADGAMTGIFDVRGGDRARRFSRLMDANVRRIAANKRLANELEHTHRRYSLPEFNASYFCSVKHEEEQKMITKRSLAHGIQGALHEAPGVDFEILQRAQRPKFAALFRLYRKYYTWRKNRKTEGSVVTPSTRGGISPRTSSMRALTSWTSQRGLLTKKTTERGNHFSPRNAFSKLSAASIRRWSSSTNVLGSYSGVEMEGEYRAHEFQQLMTRLGKIWDLGMLFISLYHFLVTPFKVCFSSGLVEFPVAQLDAWAGWEYFLDALCIIDIGYKVRRSIQASHALGIQRQMQENHKNRGKKSRLWSLSTWFGKVNRAVAAYPEFWLDIVAMLPLEVLAVVIAPAKHEHFPNEWQLLWFLRLNRTLLTLRIDHLTEQLFQFIVYDIKLPVSEDALVFARSMTTYIVLGHFIACCWYIVAERAYDVYAYSWLSTSGMLMSSGSSSSGHSSSSTIDLSHVSVLRKYLRSLDYALESITTVFYGDIYAMNLPEMIAEMVINVWSIYIYGSLVGAHGRLLQEHSRKRATFEQNLFEMQHYLVQNDIPKKLKKQIKQYYARMWRRWQGEGEFSAIEQLSRSLYRDVVYTTLRRFAWQVGIFHSMDVYFLRSLLVALQYVVCSEGEEIVMIGDVDRSMYFIANGRVLVKQELAESTREKGEFFGELALLYGIARQETCIALTVAELYRLDHEPYERVLLDFPDYRARNKLEWTTDAKPPPLANALQRFLRTRMDKTRVDRSGSVVAQSTNIEARRLSAVLGVAPPVPPLSLETTVSATVGATIKSSRKTEMDHNIDAAIDSEIVEKEVPHSYVYHATMTLLSRLSQVDSLEAKHILASGRVGARRHLRKAVGVTIANALVKNEQRTSSMLDGRDGAKPGDLPPLDYENGVRKFSAIAYSMPTPRSGPSSPRRQQTSSERRLELLIRTSKDPQLHDMLSESCHDAGSDDKPAGYEEDSDSDNDNDNDVQAAL